MSRRLMMDAVDGGVVPASTEASSTSAHPPVLVTKQRNRIQLSCKRCRQSKLRCDRAVPCDQCEKRGLQNSCEYLSKESQQGPKASTAANKARQILAENIALKKRLAELEKAAHGQPDQQARGSVAAPIQGSETNSEATSGVGSGASEIAHPVAGVLVNENQRHISDIHWKSILNDVGALTLELEYEEEMGHVNIDATCDNQGPLILVGGFPEVIVEDLLEYLPSRATTDRLVTKFFQLDHPAWVIFHIPTFLKQYNDFWSDRERVSITWLALLYTKLAYASWHIFRSNEQYSFGDLGPIKDVYNSFRVAASRCLVKADYTVPGRFKIEALILYYGMESYRIAHESGALISASFLWVGVARLALYMGYHRDPQHFNDITPFEGEMRRRIWALLVEMDTVIAFTSGQPIVIPQRIADTKLPSNLQDEDISEDMTHLPNPRPNTEMTRALYQIAASPIVSTFADILSAVADRTGLVYSRILELDSALTDSSNRIPPVLRPKPPIEALMDSTGLIRQRYFLQLQIHRARCVLHRRWLRAGAIDRRYVQSRWACIDAAVQLLRIQYELDTETQPDGRLSSERWKLTRCIPDFLLGDMILCLELFYLQNSRDQPDLEVVIPPDQILSILQMSRQIWQTSHKESGDAGRALKIISRMLYASTVSASPNGFTMDTEYPTMTAPPEYPTTPIPDSYHYNTLVSCHTSNTAPMAHQLPLTSRPEASLGYAPITECLSSSDSFAASYPQEQDMSTSLDWSLFDIHVQNPQTDETMIPWETFFNRAPVVS